VQAVTARPGTPATVHALIQQPACSFSSDYFGVRTYSRKDRNRCTKPKASVSGARSASRATAEPAVGMMAFRL
jgi:hypothetical protein